MKVAICLGLWAEESIGVFSGVTDSLPRQRLSRVMHGYPEKLPKLV